MRFQISIFFIVYLLMQQVLAQCPVADFEMPMNVCQGEKFIVKNISSNSNSFEWDFCGGDLVSTPSALVLTTLANIGTLTGVETVSENGNYFIFLTGQTSNEIIRVDLGSNMRNETPSIVSLGTLNGLLNGPVGIKFIYEAGEWFGLLYNSGDDNLIRIHFGVSLSNIPNAVEVVIQGDAAANIFYGAANNGLELIKDNQTIYATVTDPLSSQVTIFRFGNSILNNPDPNNDVLTTDPISGADHIRGINLFKDCGNWYAFIASSLNNKILRLNFGSNLSNLFSDPLALASASASTDITGGFTSSNNIVDIKLFYDNNEYFGFVSTVQGVFYRLDFSGSITNIPTAHDMGDLGLLSNTLFFDFLFDGSKYSFFSGSYSTGQVFRCDFQDVCSAAYSPSLNNNQIVSYNVPGDYVISLLAVDINGNKSYKSKTISVSAGQAPDIFFSSQNICVNHDVDFTSSNSSSDVINYNWSFGDANASSEANPTHQYTSHGDYNVSLQVTAVNGCGNYVEKIISIYNEPNADFTIPVVTPICTNQSYLFTNSSTFDNSSNPTWQWSVNGNNIAVTKDLNYSISSAVQQDITLTALIPGCSSQSTQSISTVFDGPVVIFDGPATGCVNTPTSFVNTTTGTIISYNWDFGDGNNSLQANGTNSYAATGSYSIILTASNAAGCQNFTTKDFHVYSNPQPDFEIEAPPYSCANYPAQFDNNTPQPSDSNITAWAWDFGDGSNGSCATCSQKNPTYKYASASTYMVTLQATTNFGCIGSKSRNDIVILQSPQAIFSSTAACVNQSTQFDGSSSKGDIASYQWAVQNTVLPGTTPPAKSSYIFKSPGNFQVTLTVTGNNNCKNDSTKQITVYDIPNPLDFTWQAPCTRHPTIFQERTGGADSGVSWNWNFGSSSGIGSPISHTFSSSGTYSVTMSTTRNSGCVYSTSKNIVIVDGPEANFTPSVQAGGPPLTITFNNLSNADSYSWQFGDANNSSSSDFSPEFTYTQLGTYKPLLTASNLLGCADTLSAEINVVIPHVDLAMKAFSLIDDPSTNSSRMVVTISNLGNIPLDNPEVQIDLAGNSLLKEKITSTVLPGKSVQQMLSLEIVPQLLEYICAEIELTGDSDVANDRQCISLTSNDVLLLPYPNPAGGQINFDWISAAPEDVTVSIYKSNGEIAFVQNFQNVQSGINQLKINTISLTNGLYLIQFAGTKVKKAFRVMIVN